MKSFLMIGQSNMAGRGDFGEVPEIQNHLCKMLRNGRWQPMSEPINPDRRFFGEFHSGVGLAASFSDEYAKYFDEKIGLIPCADGGTRLAEWQPGEILYDHAVMQARLAQRSSEIVGILWHQGESDSDTIENVNAYREKFLRMISALIKDLSLPSDIPVVIGELGDFVGAYKDGMLPYSKEINAVLTEISDDFDNIAIASAQGLTCKDDGIHFNSASYRILGVRYFESYLSIVEQSK